MYPSSWQTELKNIGRELQHMSEELRRDVDDVYPQRLEEELLHAKSRITELEQALDLERINHQRTLEKKTRSEWDAPHNNPQKSIGRVHEEEDGARGVLLPMSLTHESEAIHRTTRSLLEAEIQDQRRQILALKEEKRSMKEWLERGVLECKRVSTEVARLTQEVHSKDQTLSELVEQRHVVAELSGQLTEKCKDAEKEIHRLRHERALLEGRFEEHHGRIHLTEDHMKKQATECERLRSEMEILTRKLGEHEDAEISLVGVAATLRQLVYDAQQLRTEVLHGTGQDSISDSEHPQQLQLQQPSQLLHNPIETLPGYYDDDDDQAIGTLRSTSRISREAAEVLQDNLRTIREKIQERLRKETERPMALQRELTETTTYYQTEMSQLKDRYERELERERQQRHELEMELNLIKEHMIQVNGDEEDVIHSMSKECKTLKERNEFLEKERTRLKEKVNRLKLDWTKVDDTRRRYRQLERERDALQSGLQQIEQENTRLRTYVTSLTDHVRDAVTPPSMMYASAQRTLHVSAGSGGSPSSMYNGANPAPVVYGHLSSNSSVIAESLYGAGGIPPLSVT